MSNLTPTIKSIQDVMRLVSGVDGDGLKLVSLTTRINTPNQEAICLPRFI